MNNESNRRIAACAVDFALPRYAELPSVGLYLDQTVQYVNGYLMAMHKGDYCVVMSKRELCIADREENEKALMKYRLILWSGTRLSEEEENND